MHSHNLARLDGKYSGFFIDILYRALFHYIHFYIYFYYTFIFTFP
jgi:hypothetical protein